MIVSAINICHLIMNPFYGDRQPGRRPAGAGHAGVVKHANGRGKVQMIQSCGQVCCFKSKTESPNAVCRELSNVLMLLTILLLRGHNTQTGDPG